MDTREKSYKEIHYDCASLLWDALSPTTRLNIPRPHNLIYRGQANSDWKLIPSFLRGINNKPYPVGSSFTKSEEVVALEIMRMNDFAEQCDRIGIAIPNDCQEFRNNTLDLQNADKYLKSPFLWPNPEILDIMAMAQHHGVRTRLLDWSRLAYTALYFAASSVLKMFDGWKPEDKLAIWVLNINNISPNSLIKIHNSRGSISPHLAAQYGQFTVHPHNGYRGQSFEVLGLEDMPNDSNQPVLWKITLPVWESVVALNLCNVSGFSAADIYPSADGAGKGIEDVWNIGEAKRRWNKDSILVKSH